MARGSSCPPSSPRAVPCVASLWFVGPRGRWPTGCPPSRPLKLSFCSVSQDKVVRTLQLKLSRILHRCRRPLTCSVLGPRRILEWHPQRNAFKRMSPKFTQCQKRSCWGSFCYGVIVCCAAGVWRVSGGCAAGVPRLCHDPSRPNACKTIEKPTFSFFAQFF